MVKNALGLLDHVERIACVGTYRFAVGAPVQWSDGMYRVLGYKAGEVEPGADAFLARVHTSDRARVEAARAETLRTGAVSEITYRVVHPSGAVRWVRGSGDTVVEPDGQRSFLGTLVDVTDEQRALASLRQAESLIDEMQSHTGVGHFVFDPKTRALHWSAGLLKLLDIPPDQPPQAGLGPVHPDDAERQYAWGKQALTGGPTDVLHVRILLRDGRIRHVETRASLIETDGGTRLVGIVTDVTERVAFEERVRQMAKLESVGTLAAGVAHDFNNYLMIIAGQVEVARAAQAQSTEGLDTALDAVQQCAILTRQLLAFGRQQSIDTRTLDVAALLTQLRPLLERAVGPRISVVVEGPPGRAFVRADAGHLESLLVNLSVNARDAMPDGGTLTLGVDLVDIGHERSADGLSPGRYARMRVADTGTGIAPDVLPRIFDPYFSTKPMSRGNGLGLASVYGTVRQHGGNISVDTGDSGSTFWVLLPATESAPPSDGKPTTQEVPKSLSVLVVDDLASVRELAAWFLRSQGLHVLTAAGGAEALEIFQRNPVDVVVTDVQMPRMGGAELARQLRALKTPPAIVFMTGYADRRDTEGLIGVVVQKPFSGDDLRRAIQNATVDSPRAVASARSEPSAP